MMFSLLAVGFLVFIDTIRAANIVSGATWTDTSGNAIQAHGGGILKASINHDIAL